MLTLDLSVFPVLRTERLVLRELEGEDAPALFAMRCDERVMRHIPRGRPAAIAEVEQLIGRIAEERAANNGITWGITLSQRGPLIGTIGFYRLRKEHHRGEVGYLLHPDHWGCGYAGEALDAAVQHGFHALGFHSIEAVTDPANHASNRLLAGHGFEQEAHFRENCHWNGRFLDSLVWSRLASSMPR